jgi:hypothetical protein
MITSNGQTAACSLYRVMKNSVLEATYGAVFAEVSAVNMMNTLNMVGSPRIFDGRTLITNPEKLWSLC